MTIYNNDSTNWFIISGLKGESLNWCYCKKRWNSERNDGDSGSEIRSVKRSIKPKIRNALSRALDPNFRIWKLRGIYSHRLFSFLYPNHALLHIALLRLDVLRLEQFRCRRNTVSSTFIYLLIYLFYLQVSALCYKMNKRNYIFKRRSKRINTENNVI